LGESARCSIIGERIEIAKANWVKQTYAVVLLAIAVKLLLDAFRA
jgi:hypothetical protein